MKETLYKLDSRGKVREWSIEVTHVDDSLSEILVNTGLEGGAMVPTLTPIREGSNIGRVNEKSVHEQAIFNAESEVRKKIKQGYVHDKNDLKSAGMTATIGKPMKGYAYHPSPDKSNKSDKRKSLDDLKIRGERVVLSTKLDGWRARFKVGDEGVTLYTSSGDVAPMFPHIQFELLEAWRLNRDTIIETYGVRELILDGEIYRHEMILDRDEKDNVVGYRYCMNSNGFAAAAAACATKKQTPVINEIRSLMQFHVFDVDIPDYHYEDRYKILKMFRHHNVIPVDCLEVSADEVVINEFMEVCLSKGYEGIMIRTTDRPYEHKRTTQLSKYKPLMDDEFQIVGFKESSEGDTLGSFEIDLGNGQRGYANVKGELGTDQKRKEIWQNQKDYLNLWVTVEFMERTPDGSLRFPQAKAFRKGKSKD